MSDQLEEAAVRGIGEDGDAEAQSYLGSPSLVRKARLSTLDARCAKRKQRGCGERSDRGECDAAVSRELEGQARKRRADEDRQDRAGIHERDCRSRGIRAL